MTDRADVVETMPRRYHHEDLLEIPTNSGARDSTPDHAVRRVHIRHVADSGANLGCIRGLPPDPDISGTELDQAEGAVDEQIPGPGLQTVELLGLWEPEDTHPPPKTVPARLAWLHRPTKPLLSPGAPEHARAEQRALEVALLAPLAAQTVGHLASSFPPEQLDAIVTVFRFFTRLPHLPADRMDDASAEEPRNGQRVIGRHGGAGPQDWHAVNRLVCAFPGAVRHPASVHPPLPGRRSGTSGEGSFT